MTVEDDQTQMSKEDLLRVFFVNLVYASAAAVMALPFLVNYSILIAKHPTLAPYAPYFFKIVVMSSMVHSFVAFVLGEFKTETILVHDTPVLFFSTMFSTLGDQITDVDELISSCLMMLALGSLITGISKLDPFWI